MSLPTASDNAFPSLLITEGTAPASPAAGKRRLYVLSADHLVYLKDSSGTVVGLVTNPMTTAGDTIYGGASGVPTRLAGGTSGYVLTSNGATSAPSWQASAGGGGALAFVRKVGSIGPYTATTSNADITGASVTLTTGAHRLRISATMSATITSTGTYGIITVSIDGVEEDATGFAAAGSIAGYFPLTIPGYLSGVVSAGSHTIKIRGRRDGAGTVSFGDVDNFIMVEETNLDT